MTSFDLPDFYVVNINGKQVPLLLPAVMQL